MLLGEGEEEGEGEDSDDKDAKLSTQLLLIEGSLFAGHQSSISKCKELFLLRKDGVGERFKRCS